jgi:hypothetical protein
MGAVGFIGLGNIGAPMAKRLLAWPDGLVVHDVRPEACDRYVAKGATAAATPAEVAAAAGVISVMVQNEEQVRSVLEGPDGILATAGDGTVVVVHSTISAAGVRWRSPSSPAPLGSTLSTHRCRAGRWGRTTAPSRSWWAAATRPSSGAGVRCR